VKLTTLWIVRDPSPHSELADIVFQMDVRGLGTYVLGCPPGAWLREQHALFTEKDEAVADGVQRLVRARPEREGWIKREAHRIFAYTP
jgi:hypothetical protein